MKPALEEYIQANLDELDRANPDPLILGRVLHQLQTTGQAAPRGILISFRFIWWAAACVVLLAGGSIIWLSRPHNAPTVAVATKTIAPQQPVLQPLADSIQHPGIDAADKDLAERKSTLAAAIREKKMVSFAGFNNIVSAAGRINAVSEAASMRNTGNDVVNELLGVLDNDPNTNVRLAALDGLARFYRDGYTRKKLLTSLKKQHDPMLQIALIGLLTRMRESGIVEELEKMVRDPATEKTVKDCAYSSILQLHL